MTYVPWQRLIDNLHGLAERTYYASGLAMYLPPSTLLDPQNPTFDHVHQVAFILAASAAMINWLFPAIHRLIPKFGRFTGKIWGIVCRFFGW